MDDEQRIDPPDWLAHTMRAAGVDPDEVAVAAVAAVPDDETEQERQAIARAGGMRCSECGDRVDPSARNVLHQVIGWYRPRDQGGQNYVIRRQPTGLLMCAGCGMRVLAGLDPNQETLL